MCGARGFDDQPRSARRVFRNGGAALSAERPFPHAACMAICSSRDGRSGASIRFRSGSRPKSRAGRNWPSIETPEGSLHLVNMHLGLADGERHWQIGHLLGHHLFRESVELPTILVGDYNDWRNTLPAGRRSATWASRTSRTRSRVSARSPLICRSARSTRCSRAARVIVRHVRVIRSRLTRRASDHLPLVVDFHLDSACWPSRSMGRG